MWECYFKGWTYYIRQDTKVRDLELHKLTLNHEKRNRNYSPSFKQEAVELSCDRGNTKQVCEELDISYSVLHRWRKESKNYGKNSFPGREKPKLTD